MDRRMIAAFATEGDERALGRLLHDCASLEVLLEDRSPASRRLERRLGMELARFLVYALSGDHAPRRPTLRGRRGTSTP